MKLAGFTDTQTEALMDLVVLGMYADHNLASAEDDCVRRLLDRLEFGSDYERQRFLDSSFTRAGRHAVSPESIRAFVTQLSSNFPTPQLRRSVYDILEELVTSDGRVTSEESHLLALLREQFQPEPPME